MKTVNLSTSSVEETAVNPFGRQSIENENAPAGEQTDGSFSEPKNNIPQSESFPTVIGSGNITLTEGTKQAADGVAIMSCGRERFLQIPDTMRQLPRWVLWRKETRDGRNTKVPYTVAGNRASTTDPASWSTFEGALNVNRQGGYDGLGFVFVAADGYVGLDFDHVNDPATGEIKADAMAEIRRLDSYTEKSQSGEGVHVIVKARMPGKRCKKTETGREMYGDARYFCTTGDHVEGTPTTVECRQEVVEELYREWFGEAVPAPVTVPDQVPAATSNCEPVPGDDALIEKAKAAGNGQKFKQLWAGQWKDAGYPSQSEGDAALLSMLSYHTGGDKDRSLSLFGKSGLNRDKWQREDYREATWKAVNTHVLAEQTHGEAGEPVRSVGDRRALTSPVNGQKGGRDKTPYAALATEYAGGRRDSAGRLLLRFWQGAWWQYEHGYYHGIKQDDVENEVMEFLRSKHPEHASVNARNNVIANLQAFDLCGLPSKLKNPSWIMNRTHADGWIATSNWLINIPNIARWLNGESVACDDMLRDLTPDLFSTFGLPYPFDMNALCPQWDDCLMGLQPLESDREALQMLFGLALVPWTKYNVFFVLYGEAGTGKSTVLAVLIGMVGEANVCCLPLSQFLEKFSRWQLTTHLLNVVGDLPTDAGDGSLRHVEGMLKDVCDGGSIPIEHKHQEVGMAPAIARCIFATNSLPTFADRSKAIWDRLRVFAFDQRFRSTPKENKSLRHQVVGSELPGVLNWAIAGLTKLIKLQPERFPEHSRGEAFKQEHQDTCDVEGSFIREYLERGTPSTGQPLTTMEVHETFADWCQRHGHRSRAMPTILQAIRRIFGIQKERKSTADGKKPWCLLGLKWQDGCDALYSDVDR